MNLSESTIQARAIEADRRQYILLFVSYVSGGVMALYGLRHLLGDSTVLGSFLLATSLAFFVNMVCFHRWHRIELTSLVLALLVAGFVLTLSWHGGHQNTALYWVFPFPAILFGLLGLRNAVIGNGLILFALSTLLMFPEWRRADYTAAETSRFLASVTIVIVVSWVNEYFRERNHNQMNALQRTREHQANTDPLTRLPNRRFIDAVFRRGLPMQAGELLPLGVVMCDIDRFKALNDSFGHQVGDRVLEQVAALFPQTLRRQDIACRTGGEEFLLILPQTGYRDAFSVAEKVRTALTDKPFTVDGHPHRVSASFGVAVCRDTQGFDAAVEQADQCLYRSKQAGRNKVS